MSRDGIANSRTRKTVSAVTASTGTRGRGSGPACRGAGTAEGRPRRTSAGLGPVMLVLHLAQRRGESVVGDLDRRIRVGDTVVLDHLGGIRVARRGPPRHPGRVGRAPRRAAVAPASGGRGGAVGGCSGGTVRLAAAVAVLALAIDRRTVGRALVRPDNAGRLVDPDDVGCRRTVRRSVDRRVVDRLAVDAIDG